jgi:glutathione synthase/RimK-type ligase-like ATP-grasp enzyme
MTAGRGAGGVEGGVAFVTSEKFARLTDDDRLAVAALEKRGIRVDACIWADRGVQWEQYGAVVLRSCWDYHRRIDEFAAWLNDVERRRVRLWNPLPVVRWNMRKTYLRDLAAAGVPTVATEWIAADRRPGLAAIAERRGWDEVVLKPVISASAFETLRSSADDLDAAEARIGDLLASREMMMQPFVREVAEAGEWSLVFIDGTFSHGVVKRPRAGDFRVQAEWGGSADPADPPAEVLAAAEAVLAHVPAPWLYARVDGVETWDGFVLLELELLEPSLFFGLEPRAASRFAAAVARHASVR